MGTPLPVSEAGVQAVHGYMGTVQLWGLLAWSHEVSLTPLNLRVLWWRKPPDFGRPTSHQEERKY